MLIDPYPPTYSGAEDSARPCPEGDCECQLADMKAREPLKTTHAKSHAEMSPSDIIHPALKMKPENVQVLATDFYPNESTGNGQL